MRTMGAGTLAGAGLDRTWFGIVPLRHAASNEPLATAARTAVRNVVRIVKGEDSLGL